MFHNNKFDLIFSIGEYCFCSSFLRACNLQQYSYPFDWLYGADFQSRMDCLLTNFKNFFEIKDLVLYRNVPKENRDDYKNNYTNLNHCHDFTCNSCLQKEYPSVKQKYDRRIRRLKNRIKQSKKVLLVYMEKSDSKIGRTTNECIVENIKKLNAQLDNKFYILYFRHNAYMQNNEYNVYYLNNNVTIIQLFNSDLQNPINTGNFEIVKSILCGGIKLKSKFVDKIKYCIYKHKKFKF